MAKLRDMINNKNDLLRVKNDLKVVEIPARERVITKIDREEIRDGGSASAAAYSLYSRFLMGGGSSNNIASLSPFRWITAEDTTNTGDGTPVTQWNDKGSNGNNLTTLTGTQTYTVAGGQNSVPYVACTSMYSYGAASLTDRNSMTAFVVAKTTNQRHQLYGAIGAAPYNEIMFGCDFSVNDRAVIFRGDGSSQSGQYSKTGTTGWVGAFQIKSMMAGYSSLQAGVNGSLLYEGAFGSKQIDNNTSMQSCIGGGYQPFSGDYYEMVEFDRVLSPSEIDIVINELGTKYNQAVTLFSDGTDIAVSFAWGDSQTAGRADIANMTAKYTGAQTGSYIFLNNDTTIDVLNSTTNNNQENQVAGFAYEMSLGYEYRDRTGIDHILIKQGISDGALDKVNFAVTNYSTDYGVTETTDANKKYHTFISQYFKFLYYAQQGSYNPKFKCVTDFQGGADATILASADDYQTNKEEWIDRFREHTGLELPVYQVLIPDDLNIVNFPYKATIRTAQETIATARSYVHSIDADAFALKTDGHMKALGEEFIGLTIAGKLE